jgi:hypothetical protein
MNILSTLKRGAVKCIGKIVPCFLCENEIAFVVWNNTRWQDKGTDDSQLSSEWPIKASTHNGSVSAIAEKRKSSTDIICARDTREVVHAFRRKWQLKLTQGMDMGVTRIARALIYRGKACSTAVTTVKTQDSNITVWLEFQSILDGMNLLIFLRTSANARKIQLLDVLETLGTMNPATSNG